MAEQAASESVKENDLTEVMVSNAPAPALVAALKPIQKNEPTPAVAVEENDVTATVRGVVHQVELKEVGGGALGLFATLTLPRAFGWSSGLKGLAATGVTALGGAWLVSKWDSKAGKAFAIAGVAVLAVQVIKMVLNGTGLSLFGVGQGKAEPEIFGNEGFGDALFGSSNTSIGQGADELFGTGDLEPTYAGLGV